MLGALAIVWLTADVSVEHLSIAPDHRNGAGVHAGVQIEFPLRPTLSFSLTGRAGATYAADWRPVFEGVAAVSWLETVEAYGGLRHDERLRRDGALAGYRDPTGRTFVGIGIMPLTKGAFSAGGSIEYERALPGGDRLPAGTRLTAVARFRVRG